MTDAYGSLCSGIGGLDIAVESVFGVTAAWHSEINPDALAVHDRHWPSVPNLGDLTAIDWATTPPIELICAGYPCQPFSHAGARRGEDDERHLWPYIAEAVWVLRPRWVVLENVAGHLSLGFGAVVGDLAEAGYDAEWCCLRASDVGAPHRRERVFVLAQNTERSDHRSKVVSRQADGEESIGPSGRPSGSDPCAAADSDSTSSEARSRRGWRFPGQRRRLEPMGGGAPTDADTTGHTGRQRHGDGTPAADTDGPRRRPTGHARPDDPNSGRSCPEPERRDREGVEWGVFGPAVDRWERVLGRPAPDPVDRRGRLSPVFVEWMMGYPAGWVDGLSRTAALKALGNAVVPQQGIAALTAVLDAWEAAA